MEKAPESASVYETDSPLARVAINQSQCISLLQGTQLTLTLLECGSLSSMNNCHATINAEITYTSITRATCNLISYNCLCSRRCIFENKFTVMMGYVMSYAV